MTSGALDRALTEAQAAAVVPQLAPAPAPQAAPKDAAAKAEAEAKAAEDRGAKHKTPTAAETAAAWAKFKIQEEIALGPSLEQVEAERLLDMLKEKLWGALSQRWHLHLADG